MNNMDYMDYMELSDEQRKLLLEHDHQEVCVKYITELQEFKKNADNNKFDKLDTITKSELFLINKLSILELKVDHLYKVFSK